MSLKLVSIYQIMPKEKSFYEQTYVFNLKAEKEVI